MFTGIIQHMVRVAGVTSGPKFRRLTLPILDDWRDVKLGDSIAINGVCLTVAEMMDGTIGFDVIKETLDKTNLGLINEGDEVHVERALRVGDRIDGHFVLGHVDGTARIVSQTSNENEWRTTLEVSSELSKFVAPKGSVCLDGISLTVARLDGPRFDVALIPTTLKLTTIGRRDIGWPCNFEADILTKSVVNWLEARRGRADDLSVARAARP